MQNGTETSIDAIYGVDLEPEEEIVLVVAPYDFDYYSTEGNLRYNHTIPYFVKEVEAILFMCSFAFYNKEENGRLVIKSQWFGCTYFIDYKSSFILL